MFTLLSIFGELERFMSEELYPYRYPLTGLALVALVVGVAVALRLGVHRLLWRHRVATAVIGTPLLILAIVGGNYALSPLWERSFLEEASPIEAAATDPSAAVPGANAGQASASQPSAAGVTLRGSFRGADDFHFGRGDAQIVRTAEGKHVVRFENFSVRNGPDLFVYVSRESDGRRVDESLNLGKLKATDGAFNYDLPSNIDPASIKSVLVWCKQFTVLFAIAELKPAM